MILTRCRVELKWEDAWIGAFWKTTHATTDAGKQPMFTDVWICLVPCLPLHLTFLHRIAIPFHPEDASKPQPLPVALRNEEISEDEINALYRAAKAENPTVTRLTREPKRISGRNEDR